MDDALVLRMEQSFLLGLIVLILVLMDDALVLIRRLLMNKNN